MAKLFHKLLPMSLHPSTLLSFLLFSWIFFFQIGASKFVINNEMKVNGTLTADLGDFKSLNVSETCTISAFLSSDSLIVDVLDTASLYTNYIYPSTSYGFDGSDQGSRDTIYIYGTLVIEDPEEEDSSLSSFLQLKSKA